MSQRTQTNPPQTTRNPHWCVGAGVLGPVASSSPDETNPPRHRCPLAAAEVGPERLSVCPRGSDKREGDISQFARGANVSSACHAMNLSRERKTFVVICGLALVALVVDRTLLDEAVAEDAPVDPSSLLLSSGSSGAPGARPATNATVRKGGDASSAAAVSNLLAQMAERNRRQLEQTPDAFQPGSAWSAPDMTQPGAPAADVRVETFAK